MKLKHKKSRIFVPDGTNLQNAIKRTTHLCIAAHQDDVEIMSYGAITECFSDENKWFSAVVITDGAGSPRDGEFASMTDEEMQKVRAREQDAAAAIGKYSVMFQLGYPSNAVKFPGDGACTAELVELIKACTPEIIFTHNPADKHDTHVGVMLRVLEAVRLLPKEVQPKKIYALEVWRGLDWLGDEAKVIFDTASEPEIAKQLLSVFVSQCAGGKRYDLAALGRRRANATFLDSHAVDTTNSCSYGMDITELIDNPDVAGFLGRHLDDMRNDIMTRIKRLR
ncbi:MAG: PIG-L family deacetylase [Oscillospiraceae bacterium]|nr:PIG-L family deacetylase [Oscillospiraceae bacterium]